MKREYEPLTVEQQQYLERQLAERELAVASLRQSLTVMQPEYENTKWELEEAQGKLAAVRQWRDGLVGEPPWNMDTLDRILGGKGD